MNSYIKFFTSFNTNCNLEYYRIYKNINMLKKAWS